MVVGEHKVGKLHKELSGWMGAGGCLLRMYSRIDSMVGGSLQT